MTQKLRPPTKAERAAGLPTSKAESIKAGFTRFIPEDGQERIIRKYGTSSYPTGTIERSSARKVNRGGGTDGSRKINEQLATPKGADKKAFGKAMADANAKGMDGDHIQEISRTAEGIRFKEGSGRGTKAEYHTNMKKAGIPVGNQAANVQPLTPDINQRVKPAELRSMDQGIKTARGSFKGLNLKGGSASMKFGASWVLEYLYAIDEITGGHLTGATPQKAVAEHTQRHQNARQAIQQKGKLCLVNGAMCIKDFGLSEMIGLN